jgi:CheY-like chemotaxis protein
VGAASILCIDDELMVRKTLGRFLKLEGHRVTLAEDGKRGVELFRQGRFDVVIVDRAMPVMNGDQVARAIKAIAPRVPVIMVTGFGQIMEDQDERLPDVDLVLGKPIDRAGLQAAVAKVLAGAK